MTGTFLDLRGPTGTLLPSEVPRCRRSGAEIPVQCRLGPGVRQGRHDPLREWVVRVPLLLALEHLAHPVKDTSLSLFRLLHSLFRVSRKDDFEFLVVEFSRQGCLSEGREGASDAFRCPLFV